jgi:repressor LexA
MKGDGGDMKEVTSIREPSDKRQRILRFINSFIDQHDYPPSIRQIQEACGISSTSVVDYNLKALERAGLIRRDREISRGIYGTGKRSRVIPVPIIGTIAAGQPIPAPEDTDTSETIDVTPDMIGNRDAVFALRVKGNSMIDALVNDGDIVLMEKSSTARDGEMVAAWLKDEQETTLKKFYPEGDRVRLQPANETMQPIYTDAANVEIQGKVIRRISADLA